MISDASVCTYVPSDIHYTQETNSAAKVRQTKHYERLSTVTTIRVNTYSAYAPQP